MDPGPVTYRPDTLLEEAMHHMQGHGEERPRRVERVLVTTSDGELVGILWLDDAEKVATSRGSLAHAHG
jgi:CBS domain-containing protein